MNKRILFSTLLALGMALPLHAQRTMDRLDRGLVAVPGRSSGNLVSWRKLGEEYYDTQYNLYRDGARIASGLSVSNFQDAGGNSSSSYQVEAVVNGELHERCAPVKAWARQYLSIPVEPALNRAGKDVTAGYSLNDISLADVDGDGVPELMLKRRNDSGNLLKTSNRTDFNRYEVYTLQGKRLWWIDLGPNLMSGPDEQWDMIGYDWDGDGRAEALMRGADNMIIHTADGHTINIGDMNYDNGGTADTRVEYTRAGKEYLLYLDGATGVPYGYDGNSGAYTPPAYPLPRFEQGETDYAAVWGSNDTGHRACKHYFGAPCLDGRRASIFLGRGCYTRHKMCALDVDPVTHKLSQRWRWNTYDASSPWFGNGFHNFQIADVDMDGRDEIVFGSMIIDDNGRGLATTGLGHGDAQHCGDLDPYRWGLEQFTCQEGSEGNSYWNATTGQLYYRKADGGDDGRALAGNFTNDYPGGQGRSVSSGIIGLSSDKILPVDANSKMKWDDLNCRIYWDGDLLDEIFDSPGVERAASITKWGNGRIFTSGGQLNNSSKNNPCALGDILGDWREEFIVRNGPSELQLYTTNYPTEHAIYTLWHDHEYRNAMAWQCVGYNQPPHPSFFLGELEGITVAPPPVTLTGRRVVADGSTLRSGKAHLLLCDQADMTVGVADGASPWIVTDNAPAIVAGTGGENARSKTPERMVTTCTHTLTGGAFGGATRLVKQGEGVLVLPNVTENHSGPTDIWNGTLRFDGTMAKSPVWLNRHTRLVSRGGHFLGGLRADYNATLLPGDDGVGSLSASRLDLGIGARVVFDIVNARPDTLNADTLVLQTKDWGEYGPKYKAPVFEFRIQGELPDGDYTLGRVDSLRGRLADILLEGLGDRRTRLVLADGRLSLHVETLRSAAAVRWNGTDDSHIWDFGVSENFLNGDKKDYSAPGDDVTFDDRAASTQVEVKGAVRPASLLFTNDTKAYTLSGDSIVSPATLRKTGAGTLTVASLNRMASTEVSGGRLVVNSLGNLTGVAYGALGTAASRITLSGGATFGVARTIITDQPFFIGSGGATFETPGGTALTLNRGLAGAGNTVTKTGDGTLTLGTVNTIDRLVIARGTVNDVELYNQPQLPATVEFGQGTLYDPATENSSSVNPVNFVVPEGCTGTFHADPRCNYTGRLTGRGTFNVYDAWVRCTFSGDWSDFEGTVVPRLENRTTKHLYTNETFDFTNSHGLPRATLNVPSGVTVSNNGHDFPLGSVTGAGTLAGSGAWIVGVSGNDFNFGVVSTSKVVKRGAGRMNLSFVNKVQGQLQVDEGMLSFTSGTATPIIGSTLTVNGEAEVKGTGLVSAVTLNGASRFSPVKYANDNLGGVFRTSAMFKMAPTATANFVVSSKSGTAVVGSRIECGNFLYLGNVCVRLADGYTPAVGDSICLWTCQRVMQAPTSVTLPELPAGMAWERTSLTDKSTTGYLRIVAATTGLGRLSADVEAAFEVYAVGGAHVGRVTARPADLRRRLLALGLAPGTYIARSASSAVKVVLAP